ncbi:MAG: ATP-binding cassette domain-containing protein, partial [Planctomycetota bacterium]|nr:ATP-binding cassette domain-containing protein [Planctomycetota bacterium]
MSGADLSLRGVTRMHGRRIVLQAVDLDVPGGTSLVLLGSSGAGKTTLLRIVAGLDEAGAGSVQLGDRVLSDPRIRVAPEERRIGMVFQALELWPQMTVAEHIAFGLPGRPKGRAARRHPEVRALA